MKDILPQYIQISSSVLRAKASQTGIVALESTVLTHGLPYPQNMETMQMMEESILAEGAIPATIIVIDGKLHIGLDDALKAKLATYFEKRMSFTKLSVRDLPLAIAKGQTGGTTVSATMYCAMLAGISVFATGGIGGVHRDWQKHPDISTDLIALSKYPVIVVSAGCKAILDISATIEILESLGVPVLGWKTDSFPAFYSAQSSYPITRIDSMAELCKSFLAQIEMGKYGGIDTPGILLANPIPLADEIPSAEIEPHIMVALSEASKAGISGKALTPFLLAFLADHTKGRSVQANLKLLNNNAILAAKIAVALSQA